MTASPFLESKFPVGSSARRIEGSARHRARHRHTLLLATRPLARQVPALVRHLHLFQRLGYSL